MHQIITGSAARHNSGVRHNFRADCTLSNDGKMFFIHKNIHFQRLQLMPALF
jgi:hypothetical protein